MPNDRVTLKRYSLPAPLVQALADLLNEMPAKLSRRMLNELEAECVQQDAATAAPVQAPARRPRAAKGGTPQ